MFILTGKIFSPQTPTCPDPISMSIINGLTTGLTETVTTEKVILSAVLKSASAVA